MKAVEFRAKIEEFFKWSGEDPAHRESAWFMLLEDWANRQFNRAFEDENTIPATPHQYCPNCQCVICTAHPRRPQRMPLFP